MKRTLILAVVAASLVAVALGTATTASATPNKTIACTGCHAARTTVKVGIAKVSSTASTVTYKVAITGGSGQAGWTVLSGGKNLAHRTASTGTFKIAKGKKFRLWGVKKGTGTNYRTITAR